MFFLSFALLYVIFFCYPDSYSQSLLEKASIPSLFSPSSVSTFSMFKELLLHSVLLGASSIFEAPNIDQKGKINESKGRLEWTEGRCAGV
jgi:hypothetical protein